MPVLAYESRTMSLNFAGFAIAYAVRSRNTYFLIILPLLLVTLALFYIQSSHQGGEKHAINLRASQAISNQTVNASTGKPREQLPSSEGTKYVLNSEELCVMDSSRIHIDYLVLIFSAPRNFDQRNAIRETWSTELQKLSNSRVAFLLAKVEDADVQRAIESESYLHSDIIQGTYIDSYQNQSLKAKMMLKWALEYCPQVSFLLKSDDDSFVNVPKFLKVIRNKRTDAIHGQLYLNAKPFREKFFKWYVSLRHYNGTNYPPYVSGALYALGGSIVRRLYDATEQVPFFWIEDVFITGFVAEKAGVDRINEDSISANATTSLCDAHKKSVSHKINATNLRFYWYMLHYSFVRC